MRIRLRSSSIILTGIVGAIINLSLSAGALAAWNNGSYTIYSVGTYGVTAPQPGVNTYYAEDSDTGFTLGGQGNRGTGILYYDPNPPTFASSAQTLAANSNKSVTLSFSDALSGVASASVTIFDPNNISIGTFGGGASLSFNGNFSKVGKYKLNWSATDNATNSANGTVNDFFTVVAGAPAWGPGASSITTSANDTKIADGADSHAVTLTLRDQYGNPVVPVSGPAPVVPVSVNVKFKFENTNPLDQIAGTGDALRLAGACNLTGADTGSTKITECTATTSANGVYNLNIYSYAPTSGAYAPIAADNFKIKLTTVDYEVTGPGSGSGSRAEQKSFNFNPTLAGSFTTQNYDASGYSPASDADTQVTINAIKRFGFGLDNNSATKEATNIRVGADTTSSASEVNWINPKLEFDESNNLTDLSNSFSADGWNDSPVSTLDANSDKNMRLQAVPELTLGSTAPAEIDSTLTTRLKYTVNGRVVAHKTEKLSPKIYNHNAHITGTSRSTNTTINIGDFASAEIKTAITRNVATFTNDSGNSDKACGTSGNVTATSWETLSCGFRQDTILYFKDTDVHIDATQISSKKTLLIENGNLYIESNLTTAPGGALGIIVLGNNGKGNVKIAPNVTQISAFLYAEGSVVSVNSSDEYMEEINVCEDNSGGFCDRAFELRNQLFWKGIVISRNTIGGSDKNPFVCPTGMTTCSNDRSAARLLDFNYLRTFHPIGTEFSGNKSASANSNSAFTIQFADISSNTPPLFEGAPNPEGVEIAI